MKRKQWKGFISGVLTCVIVLSLVMAVTAKTGTASITATYRDIKITMNGTDVDLVDANGNTVDPFIYKGTTYLPIRAVATALGLDVDWDNDTNTVILTTPDATPVGSLILDSNDMKIYYNGITASTSYSGGYEINLTIVNNSDEARVVVARDISANGFMVGSYDLYTTVAAGKTANDKITITKSDMEDAGITGAVTSAEFYFHVYRSSDSKTVFNSDIITIN